MKRKRRQQRRGGAGSNVGHANIVSLGGKNAGGNTRTGPATPGRRPKVATMEGAGYRLSDGRRFAGSLLPSVPSRKYGKADGGGCATMGVGAFRSEDDVANKLLSLLGGGGGGGDGGGNMGRYVQSAMRGAIAKLYEVSRAAVHTAIDVGEYALLRVRGGSVVDGGGVVLGTADDDNPHRRSSTGDEGGCGVVRVNDNDNVPHETMVLHGGWWAWRACHHPPSRQRQRREHERERGRRRPPRPPK